MVCCVRPEETVARSGMSYTNALSVSARRHAKGAEEWKSTTKAAKAVRAKIGGLEVSARKPKRGMSPERLLGLGADVPR
jgi:hypothetical protein